MPFIASPFDFTLGGTVRVGFQSPRINRGFDDFLADSRAIAISIGRQLQRDFSRRSVPAPAAFVARTAPCPEGQTRNPVTGLCEGVNVGFLDDIITTVERLAPVAQQLGFLPPPDPIILNAGGRGPGQTGVPVIDFAGLPAIIPPLVRQLPGIVGGLAAGELFEGFFGNGGPSRVGGIMRAGRCDGVFHTTPTGKRLPNRVSLVEDGSGAMAFMVNAGRPLTWSKISLKKSSPRHHHHRPR